MYSQLGDGELISVILQKFWHVQCAKPNFNELYPERSFNNQWFLSIFRPVTSHVPEN